LKDFGIRPSDFTSSFHIPDEPHLDPQLFNDAGHQNDPAEWAYQCSLVRFKQFESQLDYEHEIGLRLVSFGEKDIYHINGVSYISPHLLIFRCNSQDGGDIELIQNVSQLNILLAAVPKLGVEPRRIGFDPDKGTDKQGGYHVDQN
jgi:hypothetical protein